MILPARRVDAVISPRRICRARNKDIVARKRLGAEHDLHRRRMRVGARLEHPFDVMDVVDVAIEVDVRILRLVENAFIVNAVSMNFVKILSF